MAYADIYTAANDEAFQGRCMAAAWSIAAAIQRNETLTNSASASLNTDSCKNFALKLLRDQATVSPKQVAMQILRNATIAGNVGASTDSDIQWQMKEIFLDLVEIG